MRLDHNVESQRWDLGPIVVKSPVYLCTALFWIYITGMAGLLRLPGVIVALMRVYAPIALLLLIGVALYLLPNLGSYRLADAISIADNGGLSHRWPRHGSVLQLMTGFFAIAGLLSVDWGARAERQRDLFWCGLTGIVVTASLTSILSLVVVASTVARLVSNGAAPGGKRNPCSSVVLSMGSFLRNRRGSWSRDPDSFRFGRACPCLL